MFTCKLPCFYSPIPLRARDLVNNLNLILNKNLKNPLMLSVTYGLHAALMAMRLKASFHASPDAIIALHAKHRQQQRKNPGFQPKKPRIYHLLFS